MHLGDELNFCSYLSYHFNLYLLAGEPCTSSYSMGLAVSQVT
jgi:hypothetical protein